MSPVAVDLFVPSRLRRWVMPLALVGLAGLIALAQLSPITFVWGRFVFLGFYAVLAGVGLSSRKRAATVTVDASGLCEGSTILVARAAIERVVAQKTSLDIRGKTPMRIEVADPTVAAALLDALDHDHATRPLVFLATTTPVALAILAWIGIPAVVSSVAVQPLLGAHLSEAMWIALAVPAGTLWLTAVWWFGRRRRVTLTTTDLHWPRVIGNDVRISLGEVTHLVKRDAATLEVRFGRRRARSLKIYDAALLAELVEQLGARANIRL